MDRLILKRKNALRRANRVRTVIAGTPERPRLAVRLSHMHVSAQLIDDSSGRTLASATTVGQKTTGTMTEKAAMVGKDIAVKAAKQKISKATLDRGPKQYHGRIKALAEAAREAGLEI